MLTSLSILQTIGVDMSVKNISLVLLALTSLVNFSCEKTDNQGQPLKQTPAHKNTRLDNFLSAKNPDYAYVATLLPKYYDCVELVFEDEATRTMLKPVFEHAADFAKAMNKKPRPYTAADLSTHDKNINELSTQIENSIANLSKAQTTEFDTCFADKEPIAKEELRVEREKARAVLAEFSVTEEEFVLTKIGSDFKAIDYEAFAKYLDTKFRLGLESIKKIVDAKADFDVLVKAVEEINNINQKGVENPDFKKFSDARDALNTKIAQGLNKKINQGQKDDLMKEFFGIAVYDAIKDDFKTIDEKTNVVREKTRAVADAALLTPKHLEEAITAADDAIAAADNSGLDANNIRIIGARKVAKEAYVLAASAARKQAENHQALAETAKTNKKSADAADSAKMAKEFFDAIKLLKTKEPDTALDVDAAEKAHNLAQTTAAEALLAEPASVVEQAVKDSIQDVTTSFTSLDSHLKNLPKTVDKAATITEIIKEGDKIASLIDVANLKISTAKQKGLDVSLFNKSIADSEDKVKKAYENAAQKAKTIAEAQSKEVQAQHTIIKNVIAHIATITKPGDTIDSSVNKSTLIKIKAADDAVLAAKDAFDIAHEMSAAVEKKFVTTLAVSAKSIGDQAVAAAKAAQKTHSAAKVDAAQMHSDYDNKVVPVVKKTKVIKTAVKGITDAKNLDFTALKAANINAIKDHDTDPEKKAIQFKKDIKAAVDEITELRNSITIVSDDIILVRKHKTDPVLDTDPLLLKADAEDVISGLNQEVAKLEGIIVAQAVVEVGRFRDLAKGYQDDAEGQKGVAEDVFTPEDDKKVAAQSINTSFEQVTALVHAANTVSDGVNELKDPSVLKDKTAIKQAIQKINGHAQAVSDAIDAVKGLL